MRIPSRTVRIERKALAEAENLLLPLMVGGFCQSCGGGIAQCSPPYVMHDPACVDAKRHRVVVRIINEGILRAKGRTKCG